MYKRQHELLYEAGGSKELMRVLKDYHEYVGRVRKVTLGETKRAKKMCIRDRPTSVMIQSSFMISLSCVRYSIFLFTGAHRKITSQSLNELSLSLIHI